MSASILSSRSKAPLPSALPSPSSGQRHESYRARRLGAVLTPGRFRRPLPPRVRLPRPGPTRARRRPLPGSPSPHRRRRTRGPRDARRSARPDSRSRRSAWARPPRPPPPPQPRGGSRDREGRLELAEQVRAPREGGEDQGSGAHVVGVAEDLECLCERAHCLLPSPTPSQDETDLEERPADVVAIPELAADRQCLLDRLAAFLAHQREGVVSFTGEGEVVERLGDMGPVVRSPSDLEALAIETVGGAQ